MNYIKFEIYNHNMKHTAFLLEFGVYEINKTVFYINRQIEKKVFCRKTCLFII